MMNQGRLTDLNKGPTAVQDARSGGGKACVREEDIWEFSVLSTQLCCEATTAL